MLVTTYQLILQLMIIDLQFTTPAWRAVIPTTHLTFTALQKTLGFTPPPPILTPGSWLREGKLLREWPQQEAVMEGPIGQVLPTQVLKTVKS